MVQFKKFRISCPNTGLLFIIAGMAVGNYSYEKYQEKYLNKESSNVKQVGDDGFPSNMEDMELTMAAFPSENADDMDLAAYSVSTHHPLDPLTAVEMKLAAQIVRLYNTSSHWQFKCIGLREPDKTLMTPYFETATNPPPGLIPRLVNILITDPVIRLPVFAVVNLSSGKVEKWTDGKPGDLVGTITNEDADLAQNIALAHPDVVSRLKAKGINDFSYIVADIWDHGYIADNPTYNQAHKLIQVYFYYTKGAGNNYYAHPLDFVVFVELGPNVVRGIENLPIQQGFDTNNRNGASVPTADADIFPEHIDPQLLRHDLHRLEISQPEGASYTVRGREVSWHGFNFRISFNPREGFYFYTITYNDNGDIRPIIYRLSMSEVYLNYGDPRPPYQHKSSYEMGNGEFGSLVQTLPVHQFCRGNPTYFDIDLHNEDAQTWRVPASLCITEEDAGILWTHTDDASGKINAVRNQRLAVSSLVSYGNTDYWISWRFYQDATIDLGIKVSGVLSTNLMAVDVKDPLYGNLMMPQVYTENYQHFFAVRIDADIDGIENTVSMEDIVRVSPTVDQTNPYGNGITVKVQELYTPIQAATDSQANRYWRISNKNVQNKLNGKKTSYKVVPEIKVTPNFLTLDSPQRENRLTWAKHNMWVLPYDIDHIYASGQYLDCGVNKWTKENPNVNINNTDVVLWYVFNYVHIPEVEDWPVFSSQNEVGFSLRPANFFANNPALYSQRADEMTYLDGQQGWKAQREKEL